MIKNTDFKNQNFPTAKKYIPKRQILRFAAAGIFMASLFSISLAYCHTLCDDADLQAIPEGTYITEKSKPTSTTNSDLKQARKSALPDKKHLLSIIDTLSTDEDAMLSIPEGFCSEHKKELQEIIDSLHENDNTVSFILLDINSGSVFCMNPDFSYYSASTIKGPYVAALNKFDPEIIDSDTKALMENTIMWSSNEDFETLHFLYGNDALYEMTEYTNVSDSIIDEYDWYPYLAPKELTKLWIGIYWYFFADTNENSIWCRSLYTGSLESFIGSALGDDYTVYTKPGWYTDWEDVSRNDAGIILADDHAYILTIMSDAFDSYDELEELAAVLGEFAK